jgi:hypothetical protein
MRRARPDELTARTRPLFTAQMAAEELQQWLPVPFDEIDDPFAAAEPSKGALVELDSGDYLVVHYGLTSGQLMVEAVEEGASMVLQAFFDEVPLPLARVLWHREGTELPTVRPGLRAVPTLPVASKRADNPEVDAAGSRRPRILLALETAELGQLLMRTLENVGSVDEAPTAARANGLLARKSYDIVILDIALRNLSSIDWKHLSTANTGRKPTIILITGPQTTQGDLKCVRELFPSISAIIRMPGDPEPLLDVVRQMLPQATAAADMVS